MKLVKQNKVIPDLLPDFIHLPFLNGGFTLLEILVVVLIIGILGAIAVPQYQRAVLKSRFAALMPIAKSMADSNEAYYLEHGEYADNAQDLPVQGRQNYSDGTSVYLYPGEEDASFVQVGGGNIPNARYVIYQKHSANFPDTAWCEAGDERAEEMCVAFGGQEQTGLSGNSSLGDDNWKAYLLSGMVRSGDSFIICPKDTTCDGNGNITQCPNGKTLKDGECVACDIENAATCSTTSYAATSCNEGYIVNNGQCEVDQTLVKLQTVKNTQCPANQSRYVCSITKDGTVSKCDTTYAAIDEETGECVVTRNGTYETVYDENGKTKAAYTCHELSSGHCFRGRISSCDQDGNCVGKIRHCSNSSTTMSKEGICADGEYDVREWYSFNEDYTYDSRGRQTGHFVCSAVGTDGECTAYRRMIMADYSIPSSSYQYVTLTSTCIAISQKSPTTCDTYIPSYASNPTTEKTIACFSRGGYTESINADGSCLDGYSWQLRTRTKNGYSYSSCHGYDSIDWETVTCN